MLDTLLVLLVGYHLMVAPYTKVEESFTMQAAHDVMVYGVYPEKVVQQNYDHVNFPGVVPRSFVGSLFLGYIAKGIVSLLALLGIDVSVWSDSKIVCQYVVRAVLGLTNIWSLIAIRDAINSVTFRDRRRRSGRKRGFIGVFFLFIVASLFHLLFYASRTLPNFVALPLVNYSISKLITGDISGFTWLGLTAVVFRLEVGVFAVITAIVSSLGFGQSNVFINFMLIGIGSIAGIIVSGLVDSYFWGYWVLPEFSAVYFNVFQGKSAEWGTEPFWAYFTVYIPKLFRIPLVPLLLKGFSSDPADDGSGNANEKENTSPVVPHPAKNGLRILFISSLLYVVAMSVQPHKEWRFIIYVIPIFSLQAANGAYLLSQILHKGFIFKLWMILSVLLLLGGIIVSMFMGYVSSFNYPGGEAVKFVNEYVVSEKSLGRSFLTVHLDVATCMTGFTRFTELQQDEQNPFVIYDKTEEPEQLTAKWNDFDILVLTVSPTSADIDNWELIQLVPKYNKFNILPAIFLYQKLVRDKQYLPLLILTMIEEATEFKFDQARKLLNSFILTNNYLGIYKRVGNKITNVEAEVKEQIAEDITAESSEVDDFVVQDVIEDINQEIDAIEAMHEEIASSQSESVSA